jgi:glutamyl/glutaminyl-tRNA synthetase
LGGFGYNRPMSVKVRIAPSPTGNLHIGTARTALFNWLFARHFGGQFIIRVEDTDLERSKKEYEENIITGLKWLGIESDVAITRQSERLDIYREYLKKLLDSGKAEEKHFSEEEKAVMRADGREPRDSVIVLKDSGSPEDDIVFDDMIRGKVSVQRKHVGSLVLAKDADTPLYNFAVVVDDITMDITHVIRGEDHISNTPKQMLIYEALGEKLPHFAHLPLILGPDKSKMSKRHGATSVIEYKQDYLPQALVNFMGFLGYTYSKEILTPEEMAREFDIEKVHKSGAVFDVQKLNWINAQYIRALSKKDLETATGMTHLSDVAEAMIKERLQKFSDIQEFDFFKNDPECDVTMLIWKKSDGAGAVKALQAVRDVVSTKGDIPTREELDALATAEFGGDRGAVYWPLRVALSGKKASPDPIDIATVVGQEVMVRRIDAALQRLA